MPVDDLLVVKNLGPHPSAITKARKKEGNEHISLRPEPRFFLERSFLLPALCYVFIALFGLANRNRLVAGD
jgi:hypothetical protein